MATVTTMGRLLLNDALPSSHHIDGPVTKKQLSSLMGTLARQDPRRYAQAISDLKRVGDAAATDVGFTVGLDDIEPDYAQRDKILEPILAQVKRTRDPAKRRKLIAAAQNKMLDVTQRHPGQMQMIAKSGARGSMTQLMRSVASPVAATDDVGEVIPWAISKSYAEGLKAPDAWIAMAEARRNAVESNTQVSAPGEVNKLLVNNMGDQLITTPDCGTTNGIAMDSRDPNAIDRYDAKSGSLLTAQALTHRSGTILVRSPMTCEAHDGVCQKCYGLNTRGQTPTIGTNVGMLAAHAMGEPLTQMTLNARHAVRTAQSQKEILRGLSGFKQLVEIPQSFFNKATLASQAGKVTDVKTAPQGGHYVYIQDQEHYVPPQLDVRVRKGATVEPGDSLSTGIIKPDEIVRHKGLGAGRKYLVEQLHGIYQGNGIDIDKRHLEMLAKTDLNYVRMLDKDSRALGVPRGDVVDYNRFRRAVAEQSAIKGIDAAIGETLGNNALHYTAGTRITPAVAQDLKKHGVSKVPVAPRVPLHEPIMKPISRTPLLNPDWLAKLGHRNLKNVILEGAAFGGPSDIHGTHPVPAFVFGEEFGAGPTGRY